MSDRYNATLNSEGQYQPGSNERVLLNKLDVTDPDEMDNVEFDLLADLENQLLNEIQMDSRIKVDDLCKWHTRWLGGVYEWAGRYRSVNLSKDDFHFAAANQVLRLMDEYDRKYLSVYTPCEGMNNSELIDALSICHVEYIIIHPFREGNGRLARLFATVMALQADVPPLNFEIMYTNKNGYISAIHAGHAGDYNPMRGFFERILGFSKE